MLGKMAPLIKSIGNTNTKKSQGSGRKYRNAIRKDVQTSAHNNNELYVRQTNVNVLVGLLGRRDKTTIDTEYVGNVHSSQNHGGSGQKDVGVVTGNGQDEPKGMKARNEFQINQRHVV